MAARAFSRRVTRYPNGHRISRADYESGHIGCGCCNEYRAAYCEYSRWALCTRSPSKGIAFYYYCEVCWEKTGPSGTSPKQRAFVVQEAA